MLYKYIIFYKQCANHLNEKSIATLCLCNLGVLESKPPISNKLYDDLEYE